MEVIMILLNIQQYLAQIALSMCTNLLITRFISGTRRQNTLLNTISTAEATAMAIAVAIH